jgi:Uma2 family endonuclease
MASLPHSTPVTYEEWLRMPEVNDAVEEVVNGEIRIMPPAKWNHTRVVRRVRRLLEAHLDDTRAEVHDSVFGLIIRKSPLTSRIPDIAVFAAGTVIEQDGYIHSAPQLLVEVLSPANTCRERAEKLEDYAFLGVPEVWIVSPEARTVEILLLAEGSLRTTAILAEGLLKPALFPDVQVDIAQIWPD